ncbi:hypothetical protein Slin_5322 [Spirosoma linguale DSM 74]|uniref:Uncharacterized protein n=1 Tax=Spirosoma linguale (strain ATCC 33905 / DSM 74 / LMG 10896 / Claus 1) TaxID=504472 RepID=D2QEU7_SPILD|nr:hypothetical protein Slin_5322 [Spirosoma linguale DSM 74]
MGGSTTSETGGSVYSEIHIKVHNEYFDLDLSTPGLIQKVIDYQNNAQLRDIKQKLLVEHMKNLQLKEPDDLVKLLKTEMGDKNKLADSDVNRESKTEGE